MSSGRLVRCYVAMALLASTPAGFQAPARAQVTSRNLDLVAHFDDYPMPGSSAYSACWSYVHSDGREYAVLGTGEGTAIYNVSGPAPPYFVAFIPGIGSPWREMKQYRSWIYVVTEGFESGGPIAPGIQIVRMTDPEHPVLAATYATNFLTSHTVTIDTTRALLYCNGTRTYLPNGRRGMRILSLASPEAPVEVGRWPSATAPPVDQYVHDAHVAGNRIYASSIFSGFLRVLDVANPAAPTEIASWTYDGAFTHNAWTDASGRYLYVTDEVDGQPLKIFDVANVQAPILVNAITSNPHAIVHNAHVRGNELFLSSYTEGVRVCDLSDPVHPAEFAWADSWPGASGGFHGVWEVCPEFPSGVVIASDIETGLYVYRPVRDYGIVHVRVIDEATSEPLSGVEVFLTSQGDSLATPADGAVRFAPSPGLHAVKGAKFGYVSATHPVTVAQGAVDTIVITIPTVDVGGLVRSVVSGAPIAGADVELHEYPLGVTSDSTGAYQLSDLPVGSYHIVARAPGHVSYEIEGEVDASTPTLDVPMIPAAWWDDLESESGWSLVAAGDSAGTVGRWVRVDPVGSSFPVMTTGPGDGGSIGLGFPAPGREAGLPAIGIEHHPDEGGEEGATPRQVQPESDRTPAPGVNCFVTGQGVAGQGPDATDVDGGRTSLTTPYYDLSGLTRPTIAYWRWFYGSDSNDWLAVSISGDAGGSWVPVDTVRGIHNQWEERVIDVTSFVTGTDPIRVRFVVADWGGPSTVEAAIDDLALYDAAATVLPVSRVPSAKGLAFSSPAPNPAIGRVRLSMLVPAAGRLEVDILDVTGRRVKDLNRGPVAAGMASWSWDGTDSAGRSAPPGVYFARARQGGQEARVRFVWMD